MRPLTIADVEAELVDAIAADDAKAIDRLVAQLDRLDTHTGPVLVAPGPPPRTPPRPPPDDEYVDNFRRRVVLDAWAEATADYWRRRSEQFDAARSRPGDYIGRASPADLEERDRQLAAVALACASRAAMIEAR